MSAPRRRKGPPVYKTYRVGFWLGHSSQVHEIEIRGVDAASDDDGSVSDSGQRMWSVMDGDSSTIFAIPQSALAYCIAESYQVRRKTLKATVSELNAKKA